jgi:hypothetical protein
MLGTLGQRHALPWSFCIRQELAPILGQALSPAKCALDQGQSLGFAAQPALTGVPLQTEAMIEGFILSEGLSGSARQQVDWSRSAKAPAPHVVVGQPRK